MHFATRLFLLLGILSASAPPAGALSIPSPSKCTVDPCLVASSDGALTFTAVIRDLGSNQMRASMVVLDFSGCPNAVLCPTSCAGCNVDLPARQVWMLTNDLGVASFGLRVGGVGLNGVRASADGLFLGTRTLASFDQDGDLSVTAADLALVTSRLGSHDATADFDCSGTVDDLDVALLRNHLGSSCESVVPTRADSWGSLKIRYR